MERDMLVIYCDGSGGATPGPGGVGYVATLNGTCREGMLPLDRATNQMAEILAAAYALHNTTPGHPVIVFSDSEYIVKGVTEWLPAWKARGWRTAAGRPVKNRAHWERLVAAIDGHVQVEFRWVRGHAGTGGNERADELAGQARQQALARAAA